MNAKVWITLVAGAVLLTASMAPAESYFVRNRPFTQVIKVGSEPYVPLDGFLRALGYNWNVQDGKVLVTRTAATNPTPTSSKVVLSFGGQDLPLEGQSKGETVYVPLKSVAKFLDYVVNVNRTSGIVDVVQGHLVTDKEKTVAGEVAKETEARSVAQKEAWDKKVAELKEKRDEKGKSEETTASADPAASPASEEVASADEQTKTSDEKDTKSKSKSSKSKEKATPEASPSPSPEATKEKAPEVVKLQRLEVYSSDATPDYSTGRIKVTVTIKNNGDAPAPNVQGTMTLTEPVTTPGKAARVLQKRSLRGPAVAPDKTWVYTETFNHNLGTSMPHGDYTVDVQVTNPPPPKSKS